MKISVKSLPEEGHLNLKDSTQQTKIAQSKIKINKNKTAMTAMDLIAKILIVLFRLSNNKSNKLNCLIISIITTNFTNNLFNLTRFLKN